VAKQQSRRGRESGQANPVGRPRIKLEDLDPNWREIMLQVFAEGGSDAEAKVALAIPPSRALSNDLWDALRERENEFSEAVRQGDKQP
jgi:hypothetical protein